MLGLQVRVIPEGIFLRRGFRAWNGCCALASKENVRSAQSRPEVKKPEAETAEA